MVRIIRASRRSEGPRSVAVSPFMTTARRVAAAEWEAQFQVEARVEQAKVEARAIAESALHEGHARGLSQAHAETIALTLRARIAQKEQLERSIEVVIAATRAVCERALGHALKTDDGALGDWAREAIFSLRGATRVVLHASRATLERFRAGVPALQKQLSAELELIVDDTLPPGHLRAQSDLGDLNVALHAQVEDLVAAVRDVIDSAMRSRNA
ncbi:MAG: hypothetical protein NVS3B20_22300 [Polyangiales bacterium]